MNYDVIFVHPPAIFDFRRKAIFPGVLGSSANGIQFTKVPIGLLSLAEYLDRHGYKVVLDNLGDRMVNDFAFDANQHLRDLSARVFAVGLHFQQHSQGALEVARLLKEHHPGSLVVLGGLTATCFHEEILRKYPFVDAVVRGEAEKAFLLLMRSLGNNNALTASPNLTYRHSSGKIEAASLLPPCRDLDEFEFTRFDLLQPRTSIFGSDNLPRWSLEVCRGCAFDCAICGGSAYTYRTYLGRDKPAFRSPARIIQDIHKLNQQGIRIIGLYQDPRLGGERYWRELLKLLKEERLDLDRLSLDLLIPADEDFIRAVSEINRPVTLHICPETGCDRVRSLLGRHYSSQDLLRTVRLCHKYLIPVTSFFSVGLAGETADSITETWELSEILSQQEQIALTTGQEWGVRSDVSLGGPIIGPVMIDPGSLAFDNPEKYGYQLLYKNLEDYIAALSQPSWHQWLNYQTNILSRDKIIDLILRSSAFSIDERQEYGYSTPYQADLERRKLKADIIALNEVARILSSGTSQEKEAGLKSLRKKMDEFVLREPG
jgi:B12-binding domain/radical SAM domain protein